MAQLSVAVVGGSYSLTAALSFWGHVEAGIAALENAVAVEAMP